MRFTLLVLAAILLGGCVAQSQSTTTATDGCPVEILEVNPQYHQYGPGAIKTFLAIRYRNTSGKDIRAIKFGALFFNVLDEPTFSYNRYIGPDPLKLDDPRPDKTAYWSQSDETADKADAYVIKVKFLDGTFWEDNGSYRCNAGIPILNIAKGGGLKAHEAAIKELEKKTSKD